MRDRTLAAIAARRAFTICGAEDKYRTLADVGFDRDDDGDKDWVTPYQKISDSPTGPVLVALHWLDAPSIEDNRRVLKKKGYLPGIEFNLVLNLALDKAGLQRTAIYVTQAFHLLPVAERSARIPRRHLYESFRCITRHEVEGRAVIALGAQAKWACDTALARGHVQRFAWIGHAPHPSARRMTRDNKATRLKQALLEALEHTET